MQLPIPLAALPLLAALEIGVVAYAVVPNVPDSYRAFYIDRSSWCLELEPSGEYELGTTISLARGGGPDFDKVFRCGFGVTVRDGTFLKGNLAKLDFRLPLDAADLIFSFDGRPVEPAIMHVRANGTDIATLDVADAGSFSIRIPASIVAASPGRLHLDLRLEDSGPPDHPQRDRILFHSLRLSPAGAPP